MSRPKLSESRGGRGEEVEERKSKDWGEIKRRVVLGHLHSTHTYTCHLSPTVSLSLSPRRFLSLHTTHTLNQIHLPYLSHSLSVSVSSQGFSLYTQHTHTSAISLQQSLSPCLCLLSGFLSLLTTHTLNLLIQLKLFARLIFLYVNVIPSQLYNWTHSTKMCLLHLTSESERCRELP
jgi:hypothetical protein